MRPSWNTLCLAAVLTACASHGGAQHARETAQARWQVLLADESAWSEGTSVHGLALELASFAASPDPLLRDEIGYEVSARWINSGRLSSADLRELLLLHLSNLDAGLGEGESDGVFRRSFSALHLSLLVARDRRQQFIEEQDYRALVLGIARLLREERDRRGWVDGKGWAHPIAHAADTAKFLARHPFLDNEQALVLFAALEDGFEGPNAWGENDRLAAAAQSLCMREEFDSAAFDARCMAWVENAGELWQKKPFDAQLFRRTENQKQFLRALYARMCLDPNPSERTSLIAQRTLATLADMP